jgi:hypothetical protein
MLPLILGLVGGGLLVSAFTEDKGGEMADGGTMAKGGITDLGKELTKSSSKKIEYWASYIMTSEKEQNDKIEYLEDFMKKNKLYSDLVFEGGFVGLGFNFKGTKKDLIEKLSMVSNEMKKINVSGYLAPINKTPKSVYDYILMYGENRYADGGTMAKGGSFKDRSENDSIKLAKEYQKVLDSNFDDKVYEKYQKIVKETKIPKEELQKIEHYISTTPKGKRRDIDIYRYWGLDKMADGGTMAKGKQLHKTDY